MSDVNTCDLLVKLAEEQRDSHARLRESDPKYAEYHRGAQVAYELILGVLWPTSPVMHEAPDREAELLEQREQARVGEDRYKTERDAALSLLRWLIGDLIPSRGD